MQSPTRQRKPLTRAKIIALRAQNVRLSEQIVAGIRAQHAGWEQQGYELGPEHRAALAGMERWLEGVRSRAAAIGAAFDHIER